MAGSTDLTHAAYCVNGIKSRLRLPIIRPSLVQLAALGLFIGVCAAQQLPPVSGPMPEVRRGANGQIEVITPTPQRSAPAPAPAPTPAAKAKVQSAQPNTETA